MRFASFSLLLVSSLLALDLGCENMPTAASPAELEAARGGSASAPAPGDGVKIERSAPTGSCDRLGDVTGSASRYFRNLEEAYQQAGQTLRERAAALGANYVEEQALAADRNQVMRGGVAYRCAVPLHRESAPEGSNAKPAPVGAAGFVFGDSVDVAGRRCRASGFEWLPSGAEFARCSGAPVDTGIGGEAGVRFCGERLCAVGLTATPPERNSKVWIDAFARLRSTLEDKYGEPARNAVHIPPECREDLVACLEDNRASAQVAWTWPGGRSIVLRMGKLADGSGENAIRVRYEDTPGTVRPKPEGL